MGSDLGQLFCLPYRLTLPTSAMPPRSRRRDDGTVRGPTSALTNFLAVSWLVCGPKLTSVTWSRFDAIQRKPVPAHPDR